MIPLLRSITSRLLGAATLALFNLPALAQVPNAAGSLAPVPEWQQLGPLVGAGSLIRELSGSLLHPDHIYASSMSGLLHSSNGGASWVLQARWPDGMVYAPKLSVAPTDPQRLAIARAPFGVSISADGGMSWWTPASLPHGDAYDALAFDPVVPERLFVGSDKGVWRSEDGGLSFVQVLDTTGATSSLCSALFIERDNHLRVYAIVPKNGVYYSADGGGSWSLGLFPSGMAGFGTSDVDPRDARRLLVADGNATYLSEDRGQTWLNVGPTLGTDAVAFDPLDSQRFYASSRYEGLMVTNNGGQSWSLVMDSGLDALGGHPYAILPRLAEPGALLLGGRGGVFRSADGGQTFQRSNAGLEDYAHVQSIAMDAVDPARLVARTGGSAYVSVDAGVNWTESVTGAGFSGYDVIADATLSGRFYAYSRSQAHLHDSKFWRSDDGGSSFQIVNPSTGPYFWHIEAHPNVSGVIFGAGEGVWRSDDGGQSFTSLGFPENWVWDVTVSPLDPNVIHASGSLVYSSHDGGANWVPASTQPPKIVRDLQADRFDANRAWACVPGKGMYRTDDGGQNWILMAAEYEWSLKAHQPATHSGLLLVADQLFPRVLASYTGGTHSFQIPRGLPSSVSSFCSSASDVYASTSGEGIFRLR